jgi:hypothetical protein
MINSICLPNQINQELESETTALIAGWGGKYPIGEFIWIISFKTRFSLHKI